MPEGHTLHRLARLHTDYFAGGPVRVSSPQGRFVDSVVVDGRYFDRATATGKHLFHHYEGGLTVHIHLGLYGFFNTYVVPDGAAPPAPVGQVRMRVDGAGSAARYPGAGRRGGGAGRRWFGARSGPARTHAVRRY
ncbi:DNA-formamidopyrimidine glycosylase family protein [Dietzia aerolata]|uniref:DNA-formamidopyrimidine glycosylase family protein n=1 Tax=Dietzia aerolata TaxID=595984 RepID=UPI0036DB5CC2